jgi:IS1 family transposase
MNRLSTADRIAVVSALLEGMSIRATVRMTGVAKNTVVKLLRDLGEACAAWHDDHVRGLTCQRIQADEIWSFCYAKDKNLPDSMRGKPGVGSVWTWTGICADSKLIVSWHVGARDTECAMAFMEDMADRLIHRVQLSTDGHRPYLIAVPHAFGNDIDYAIIEKIYGRNTSIDPSTRYSPPKCIGCRRQGVIGQPLRQHVSTSYVERQNLTMRMGMRRFTRLTNAFSKKLENLKCAVALHFAHYNFCRKHQTLGTTPAVAAGIADRQWSLADLVSLLENRTSAGSRKIAESN